MLQQAQLQQQLDQLRAQSARKQLPVKEAKNEMRVQQPQRHVPVDVVSHLTAAKSEASQSTLAHSNETQPASSDSKSVIGPSFTVQSSRVKKHELPSSSDDDSEESDDDKPSFGREDTSNKMEFVRWVINRHRKFPFGEARHAHLYVGRYNILREHLRYAEMMRFGLLVNFDADIYPVLYSRFYDQCRIERGLHPLHQSRYAQRAGAISVQSLPPYTMSYDSDDVQETDIDLSSQSVTVRHSLVPVAAWKGALVYPVPSLMQMIDVRLSEEERARQERQNTSLDHLVRMRNRGDPHAPPPLEHAPTHTQQYIPAHNHSGVPISHTHADVQIVDQERDLKHPMYAHMHVKNENTHSHIERQNALYDTRARAENITTDDDELHKHPYFSSLLPHMSFTERKVLSLALSRVSRFSKEDKYLMKSMPSFDGDASKAVAWWNVFLNKCASYRCSADDALDLVREKLEGTRAQAWYASVIGKMGGQTPNTILVAMLHDFRSVYMGETQQRMYEEQLMKIKCAESFTHAIVEAHWSKWSAVASAWRACGDVPVSEKKVIMTYYLSLPSELRARVQPEWLNACATVEALHAYMLSSAQLNPHARPPTTTFNHYSLTARINSLEQQLARTSLSSTPTPTHLNTMSQSQSTALVPYGAAHTHTLASTPPLDHIALLNAAPRLWN